MHYIEYQNISAILRSDYIFSLLAKEFFLSKKTVENIVFNRV